MSRPDTAAKVDATGAGGEGKNLQVHLAAPEGATNSGAVFRGSEPVAIRYRDRHGRWRYLNFPFTKGWTFPEVLGTPIPLYDRAAASSSRSAEMGELVAVLEMLIARDERERTWEMHTYSVGSEVHKEWQQARAVLAKHKETK